MEFTDIEPSEIIDILLQPLGAFVATNSSVYWVYLLSAVMIAVGVLTIRAYTTNQKLSSVLAEQLSARIWWGPSTKVDYLYFLVNASLFASFIAPLMLASVDVSIWVENTLARMFGDSTPLFSDGATGRYIYMVCFFIAYDFGRFFAHWLLHRFDVLWQFHKVHHSAEALTPFTSFRLHPVDLFITGVGANLSGGIVTGLFFYLNAGEILVSTFLGVHLFIGFYNLIGNLRHSHVWLDYGVLGYFLISPAQHQIHHSLSPHHIGKNFGFALAFWDTLFGTLYVPKEKESFAMGLGDGSDGTWHHLGVLYLRPFRLAARVLRGIKTED